jgi:hypothetical protein
MPVSVRYPLGGSDRMAHNEAADTWIRVYEFRPVVLDGVALIANGLTCWVRTWTLAVESSPQVSVNWRLVTEDAAVVAIGVAQDDFTQWVVAKKQFSPVAAEKTYYLEFLRDEGANEALVFAMGEIEVRGNET